MDVTTLLRRGNDTRRGVLPRVLGANVVPIEHGVDTDENVTVRLPDVDPSELKERFRKATMGKYDWLTFSMLGEGKVGILPRLLALWLVGIPIAIVVCTVRIVLFSIMLFSFFSPLVVVGATTVPFQMYYRDVTEFAMTNDTVQETWDATAYVIAKTLSIFVYAVRLIVEIWNGLCPLLSLMINLIYELLRLLVMVWYAAPVLQYMALWLIRLTILCTEPVLELIVCTTETFLPIVLEVLEQTGLDIVAELAADGVSSAGAQAAATAGAYGMSVDEFGRTCEKNADEVCSVVRDSGQRRLELPDNDGVEDFVNQRVAPIGDMLLDLLVWIVVFVCRIGCELFNVFGPVLLEVAAKFPMVIMQLVHGGVKTVACIIDVFKSDAFQRILDIIVQAVPLIIEIYATILCNLVVYGMPVLCYLIYAICVPLTFILENLVAPIVCFIGTVIGGCLEAFLYENDGCFECNGYHSSCGCKKNVRPPADAGCNCDGADPPPAGGASTTTSVLVRGGQTYETNLTASQNVIYRASVPSSQENNEIKTMANERTETGLGAVDLNRMGFESDNAFGSKSFDADVVEIVPDSGSDGVDTSTSSETLAVEGVVYSQAIYAVASLEALPNGRTVVMMGTSPYATYRNDTTLECLLGADGSSACSGPNMQSSVRANEFTNGWRFTPLTSNRPSWIRVTLANAARVSRVQLFWSSGSVNAPHPAQYEVELYSHYSEIVQQQQPHFSRTVTNTECKVGSTRTDSVATSSSDTVTRVALLTLTDLCAAVFQDGAHGIQLNQLRLYGQEPTSTFTSFTNLGNHGLVLKFDVHSASPNVRLWDPCACGTLGSLHDLTDRLSSVVSCVGTECGSAHVQLRAPVPTAYTPNAATILFSPGNTLNNGNSIRMCRGDNTTCVSPTEHLSDYRSPSESPEIRQAIRSGVSAQLDGSGMETVGAPFWDDSYLQNVSRYTRGASMTFDLSTLPQTGDLYLELGEAAFSGARTSTWETVMVDTGMNARYHADMLWRYQLDIDDTNGKMIVDESLAPAGCQRQCGTTLPLPHDNLAVYSNPEEGYGSVTWVAISEITVWGDYTEPTRRAEQLDPDAWAHGRKHSSDTTHQGSMRNSLSLELRRHGAHMDQTHAGHVLAKAESTEGAPFAAAMWDEPRWEPQFDCGDHGCFYRGEHKARLGDMSRPENVPSTNPEESKGKATTTDNTVDLLMDSVLLEASREWWVPDWVRPHTTQLPVSTTSTTSTKPVAKSASRRLAFFGSFGSDIGDLVEDALKGLFDCDGGQGLWDCIVAKLAEPLFEFIKFLLRQVVRLIDLITRKMQALFGGHLSLVACMGCTLVGIATGFLADFLNGFATDTCMDIVDKADKQCQAFGISTDMFGFEIFGQVFPIIKLAFEGLQALPAVVVVLAKAIFCILEVIIPLFPELVRDVAVALISVLEVLVEQLPDAVNLIVVFVDLLVEDFPFKNIDGNAVVNVASAPFAGGTSRRTVFGDDVTVVDTWAGSHCFTGDGSDLATPSETSCGNNKDRSFAVGAGEAPDQLHASTDCGCSIAVEPCKEGHGTGNCPIVNGVYQTRKLRSQAAMATVPADAMPYCKGHRMSPIVPQTLNNNDYMDSNNSNNLVVSPGGNDCIVPTITGHKARSTKDKWPFVGFSKRDGTNDDNPSRRRTVDGGTSHFATDYPKLSEIHRRRVRMPSRRESDAEPKTTPDMQGLPPSQRRTIFGVSHLFDDSDQRSAEEAVRVLLGNHSLASLQAAGIRQDMAELRNFWDNITNVSQGRLQPNIDKVVNAYHQTRELLGLGLAGKDYRNIGCGWQTLGGHAPNTYPCCKGLWCCVPPPFPDDFYVRKQWFAWNDDYHWGLQCNYLRTYADGWTFLGNSAFKWVRDSIAHDVYPWPYDTFMRVFWSAMVFPNDEWPDQPRDIAKCLALNVGIYLATIPLFILAVYVVGTLLSPIVLAHLAILHTCGSTHRVTTARTKATYYRDIPHTPLSEDM